MHWPVWGLNTCCLGLLGCFSCFSCFVSFLVFSFLFVVLGAAETDPDPSRHVAAIVVALAELGVVVDSKGRTFTAPPELEFEHVHSDEDFPFWIEVLWIGLEPRTCRMDIRGPDNCRSGRDVCVAVLSNPIMSTIRRNRVSASGPVHSGGFTLVELLVVTLGILLLLGLAGQSNCRAQGERKDGTALAISATEPEAATIKATRGWLATNAVRLETVEAGHGFGDMQPLRPIIGSARVVALGEATHGTREFFQLKHRMLEFLVTEMGFNIFAIEATMPESFDINNYVLTGQGDSAKALAGIYFWTWDTEEVRTMIESMRSYNADPNHTRKVRFYGFDMQLPARAARGVHEYLQRVDPDAAKTAGPVLLRLANPWEVEHLDRMSEESQREMIASVASILLRLDQREAKYVNLTSRRDWQMARQGARILSQNLEFRFLNPGARDRFMAENIRWMLDFEGPNAKLVAWAHNAHVAAEPGDRNASMGSWLKKMFGPEFVNFGFAFNQGSLQARDMAHAGELRTFTIGPAPEGSLDAILAGAGLSIAAVDLRALPKTGAVAEFFGEPVQTRWAGAGYVKGGFTVSKRFPEVYDALFFIEKTTAARALPEGLRPAKPKPLPHAANLGFEESTAEGRPAYWSVPNGIAGVEYQVEDATDRPHGGRRCAVIKHPPGRHYGEAFGELSQRINAAPFREQQLRLQAAVRVEGVSPGSQAYLWLTVESLLGPQSYATAPISGSSAKYVPNILRIGLTEL